PLSQILGVAGVLTTLPAVRADLVAHDITLQLLTVVKKINGLFDDYVAFFQTERHQFKRRRVPLDGIVQLVRHELESQAIGRKINWQVGPLPEVEGDPAML